MWDACTIFFLTKAKSPSTPPDPLLSFPTEVCPRAPCLKEVGNLQQLLVFLYGQQKTAAENAHIKELNLQLQQVCNV